MLRERNTGKSGTVDIKNVIDPYHISEFNDIIMKIASLKDNDVRISRGIDKMTAKVCKTAIRLAQEDQELPLNRIDQSIAINFASPGQVGYDINRIISEKLNLGQMFRYPETFRYDQTRKKDLIPREVPADKKIGININYAMEALYSQKNSGGRWHIIINHEWFELSTDHVFELVPEMLPPDSEYSSTVGVVNIMSLFDMDIIQSEWPYRIDLFDQRCVEILIDHVVSELEVSDENGLIHNYGLEWLDV
ncbi:MAG: hypothetical protein ACQESU_07930 [Halobacteriota archaeon]